MIGVATVGGGALLGNVNFEIEIRDNSVQI